MEGDVGGMEREERGEKIERDESKDRKIKKRERGKKKRRRVTTYSPTPHGSPGHRSSQYQ